MRNYILLPLLASHLALGNVFLTTNRWGGRFGDQLLLYTKAKALSYTFNIPYLYRPFHHSTRLQLHHIEKQCPDNKQFAKVVKIKKPSELQKIVRKHHTKNILCLVDYYAHINPFTMPDKFREQMRLLISPHAKPALPANIPEGAVTVAIHVRRGDCKPPHKSHTGLKCHNDRDYIKLLQSLINHLGKNGEEPDVYIHIFTDDPNPCAIARKFKAAINKRNITCVGTYCIEDSSETKSIEFGCNSSGNSQHLQAITHDFFNIASFDYLIRPYGSNFSIMSQFVGTHRKILGVHDPTPENPEWIRTYCMK